MKNRRWSDDDSISSLFPTVKTEPWLSPPPLRLYFKYKDPNDILESTRSPLVCHSRGGITHRSRICTPTQTRAIRTTNDHSEVEVREWGSPECG
jgi:hypothetical protein